MGRVEYIEYVAREMEEVNRLVTDMYEAMMDKDDPSVVKSCEELISILKRLQLEYTDETLL